MLMFFMTDKKKNHPAFVFYVQAVALSNFQNFQILRGITSHFQANKDSKCHHSSSGISLSHGYSLLRDMTCSHTAICRPVLGFFDTVLYVLEF